MPGLQKILDERPLGCFSWANPASFLHTWQDAGVVMEWPVAAGDGVGVGEGDPRS